MTIGGRAALIAATGLLVLAAPSGATTTDDGASSKPSKFARNVTSHHHKLYAHRKFHRMAHKSPAGSKADIADAAADDGDTPAALPSSIANANAQMASTDVPANTDQATSPASTQIVAADELNDVDRALHAAPSPVTMAQADTAAAPSARAVVVNADDSSTWDKTSLIGKIFIAFGGLLTMASAARMFMA